MDHPLPIEIQGPKCEAGSPRSAWDPAFRLAGARRLSHLGGHGVTLVRGADPAFDETPRRRELGARRVRM